MISEPTSPKRRHILSSINRDERPASSSGPSKDATEPSPVPEADESTTADHGRRRSKFRFKSKHRHRERDRDDDEARDRETTSSRHHHHHRRHRHHHRHKRRRSRSPTPPNPYEPTPLDPNAAFRESLFDAMADDEGAAYWEGVYGQPIHVYSNARTGPEGELEQMDDDEYAAYVRRKMWEKTNQGLLEERARREKKKEQMESKQQEARRLTKEMEESLRRGEERRKRKSWKVKFDDYAKAWLEWDGEAETLPWPVTSGSREDINSENVRDFFVNGIDPIEVGETVFVAKLREERVRWHPDKVQQRLGNKFDEPIRRDVTAVFQIIDKLWSDSKPKT